MTPDDVYSARAILGLHMGAGRPLSCEELGRMLRLSGNNVGDTVRRWERGAPNITGPASLALEALLSGWRPKPSPPAA